MQTCVGLLGFFRCDDVPSCISVFSCRIIFFLPKDSFSVSFSAGVMATNSQFCLPASACIVLRFQKVLHCEIISDFQKRCKNRTKNSHILQTLIFFRCITFSLLFPINLLICLFSLNCLRSRLQTWCLFLPKYFSIHFLMWGGGSSC